MKDRAPVVQLYVQVWSASYEKEVLQRAVAVCDGSW